MGLYSLLFASSLYVYMYFQIRVDVVFNAPGVHAVALPGKGPLSFTFLITLDIANDQIFFV